MQLKMKYKRFLSLLMALAMMLSLLPMQVFATGGEASDSMAIETDGQEAEQIDEDETSEPEINEQSENVDTSIETIDDVSDLLAFATDVNNGNTYDGKTVTLTADITLTGEWTPIGTGTRSSKTYDGKAFKGTFDGGNHTISGLTITSTTGADAAVGLFGVVDGGTVKNLNLTGVNINVPTSDLAGGAIGLMVNGAKADKITVSGAIVGNDGVGGIVGRLIIDGTISNCINNASVTSSYGGIGGIVGKAYYEDANNTSKFASVTNCTNNGTVTAPMYVGGIVGLARANVTGCTNNGAVVGGTQTGGIIGQLMAAGTVSGNVSHGKISGKNHLGGIIGDYSQSTAYTYYNVTISDNINRSELAATEQCAAIMGCNNIDGFTAMTATGNKSYYTAEGLELFGNPEDMTIDETNDFVIVAAKIGDQVYSSLAEAAAAAQSGDEIVLLNDVAEDVTLPAGVIFNGNGKRVGNITAAGEITFKGHTQAASFKVEYTNTTINIGAGACLEITGTGRMVIGHGCTFNINGTITDAKTADKATIQPSLIMPGASFTGAGVNFNVTNAYIKVPSSYCSSSKTASGTFVFNITNSIWESADKLAFESQSTAATVNFELKDSVLNTGSHLVFGVSRGEIVIDNSNVNVGTSRQIENQSTMTIKNGSVVNGAVATSSNAKNPGTLIVDNATYAVTGDFSGSDLGTGTLIVKKGATFSAGSITKANIKIDATGMSAGDEINITANLANHVGTLEVINNGTLEAKIVEGKIVLSEKKLSGQGTQAEPYLISNLADLKLFRDKVNAGDNFSGKYVKLNADIDLASEEWTPIGNSTNKFQGTFDGNDKTISNLVINGEGKNDQGFFGMTTNGEIKNLTINNAKVAGRLNVGVVAGTPYTSKYTNIKVTGLVEVNGMSYVGGVGGKNAYANWTGITVDVDGASYVKAVSTENGTAYRTYVGGVIGFIGEGGHTFKNISSNIKVIGDVRDIGGLFGIAHYGNNFENVTFTGSVQAPEGAEEVGGIAGVWHNMAGKTVTFTNVTSNGTVTVGTETTTGSIVGGAYTASNETPSTSGSLIIDGVEAWQKVAAIGETKYTSLQSAIDAAGEGATVTLLDNITLAEGVTVPAGKAFTLDLQGHTITGTPGEAKAFAVITNKGNLTIQGEGKILCNSDLAGSTGYAVNTITNSGTLTVKSGTIENKFGGSGAQIGYAIDNNSTTADAVVVIEGGTVIASGSNYYDGIRLFCNSETNENSVTVKGGEVSSIWLQNPSDGAAEKDTKDVKGSVTINGGTVTNLYLEPSSAFKAAITDGNIGSVSYFTTSEGRNLTGFITGGTFSKQIDYDLLADGYVLNKTANGFGVELSKEAYVASVNGVDYPTLQAAVDAADGKTIYLKKDFELSSSVKVEAGKTVTIDLNGYTITGTDNTEKNFGLINNNGTLTIKDSVGGGKMTVMATVNSGWGRYSAVISNNPGGTLVVDGGTIEHLGGTDMAYGIDSLTNGGIGDVSVTIKDGTVKSTYRAIRQFLNSDSKQNVLTIIGGTIEGANKAIFFHDPSTKANNGTLTVGERATLTGGVYLYVTEGSQTWPVTVSIAAAALAEGSTVMSANVPAGLDIRNVNGTWGIASLEGSGTQEDPYLIKCVEDLILFRDSVNKGMTYEGEYVQLAADINLAGVNWTPIGSATADHGFMGNFDGQTYKIKNLTITNPALDSDYYAYAGLFGITEGTDKDNQNTIQNLTIENVTINTTGHIVAAAIAYPYYTIVKDVTVCGDINITGGNYAAGVLAYTRRCVDASNLTISGNAGSSITGAKTVGGVISDIQMNGGLTANYSNFSASGLTITGEKMVGGISGIIATQSLNGATVKDVTLSCTDRVGIVAGSFGGTSTISNVTFDNVTGATAVIGATYDNGKVVEAKIGDTYYATFAAAFEAAQANDTITLLADVTADEVILIDKNLTIDGNGHKITSSASRVIRVTASNVKVTLNNVNMVSNAVRVGTNDIRGISIDIVDGVKLSLDNCSVDFTDASANDWAYAVNVTGGSGHTVTVNGGTYEGANVINVRGANNTVVVKNATLNCLYPDNDIYYGACIWVLQEQGSSVEAIGNTFNGTNAVAFNLGTGTALTESNNTDNTNFVVAKIDDTYYTDLHEAMTACKAVETVTLLRNVDLAGTEWEPVSFKGTFDGQNHVISNLTINKPGVSNTGFITSLNGTFKNVTFTNPTVTGGENTGVVAGRAGGGAALAENITVNGTIKVETTHSGYARVAAIVGGWAYGNYKNITVDGGSKDVSYIKHTGGGDGRYVAGIVGHADDVASYVNCDVKNITISGGWLCGAIAGPGPSDGLASGCDVENVDMNADYSGGMFGWYYGNGTIENSSVKNVAFTAGTTNNGAIGGYSYNADATVTNVEIVNVTNGDKALLEHVAEVNGAYFFDLQTALTADGNVKILRDFALTDTITVPANTAVVLDLNGKTISMEYAKNATANHEMILNKGNLTIQDTAGSGKLSYKYTGASLGTSYAANTVTTEPGSVLTVKSGTIENLTYDSATIAYAIDARTNGGSGDVTVNIEGGTITSLRQAVRVFANSTTNTGSLNISDGDITGRVIVQNANANANKAALNITGGTFNANEYKTEALYVGGSNGATIDMQPVISGGTFNGEILSSGPSGFITGGTYIKAPNKNLVADGYEIVYDSDNEVFGIEAKAVASVDGEEYSSLQAAVAAAQGGKTVFLLSNVTLTEQIEIPDGAKITLNLKGYKLTGSILAPNADLTVKNGSIVNTNSSVSALEINAGKLTLTDVNMESACHALRIDGAVTATINGGTYRSAIGTGTGTYHAANISGAANVTIENGTFVGPKGTSADSGAAVNVQKNATVTINGGDFFGGKNNTLAAAGTLTVTGGTFDQDPSTYVADGYRAAMTEDGKYVVSEIDYVAQVGETKFETLSEAVAVADGKIIQVLANVTLSDTLTIEAGKTVTLDLNGKTISGTCNVGQGHLIMVAYGADLTVKDSSTEQTGKITYAQGTSNVGWTIDVEGDLILESGTIELTGDWSIGYAVDVRPNAWGTAYTEATTFTMNGGNVVSSDGAVRVASSSADTHRDVSASFTMNGGEIDAAWDGVFVQQSNVAWDVLSFTINGGTIKSGLNPVRFYGPAATSYVNGEDCVDIALNGGTLTYTGTETREWLVDGILRLGGGVNAEDFLKDSAVTASETFAASAVADDYKWVAGEGGKYSLVKAEEPDIFTVYGHNVRLQDLIKIGFYFTVDTTETVQKFGTLLWTAEEYEQETDFSITSTCATDAEVESAGGVYIVETDGIYVQYLDTVYYAMPYIVTENGEYIYGDADSYSALDYAEAVYGQSGANWADTKSLVIDLLNYATAARTYFGYTEGVSAPANAFNSILSDADKSVDWNETLKVNNVSVNEAGDFNGNYIGTNINLLEAINIGVYFQNTTVSGGYYWDSASYETNTVHDQTTKTGDMVLAESASGYVKYSVPGIYSFNIYDNYYVRGYNAEGQLTDTIGVSVAAYLTQVIEAYGEKTSDQDMALVALCKAMQVYGYNADTNPALNQ